MTDLIVNPTPPRVQYLADGTERAYGFPFALLDAADLLVWLDDLPSPLAYSVSGLNQSAGGSILFASPPPAGCRITLARRMAIKRETDFVEGGEFRARALNEELDRLTLLVQQVAEATGRAIAAPAQDMPTALTLPPAALRANRLLHFDAAGNAATTLPDNDGVLLQAAAAAASAELAAAEKLAAQAARLAAEAARDNAVAHAGLPVPFVFDTDGATMVFELPLAPVSATALLVFVGGTFQRPPAWSLSGATLSFATPPPAGPRMVLGLIASQVVPRDVEARFQALAWQLMQLAQALLKTEPAGTAATLLAGHAAALDPHPQYLSETAAADGYAGIALMQARDAMLAADIALLRADMLRRFDQL